MKTIYGKSTELVSAENRLDAALDRETKLVARVAELEAQNKVAYQAGWDAATRNHNETECAKRGISTDPKDYI